MAFARSFPIGVIRQRGDGTFLTQGRCRREYERRRRRIYDDFAGEEAEARGREPSENGLGTISRRSGCVDESVNACLSRGSELGAPLENGGPIERREGYWRRL